MLEFTKFISVVLLFTIPAACSEPREHGDVEETGTETGEASTETRGDMSDEIGSSDESELSDESGTETAETSGTAEASSESDETTGGDTWLEPYALYQFNGDFDDAISDAHGTPSAGASLEDFDGRQVAVFGMGGASVDGMGQTILGWPSFSIAVRLYAWDVASQANIISVGEPDEPDESLQNNGFGAWLYADSVCIFSETADSTDNWAVLAPAFSAGEWHTVVLTFESDFVDLYIDGVYIDEKPYVSPASATDLMQIGGWSEYYFFQGAFDQLAIYDRVLTPVEISMVGLDEWSA